MVKIGEGTLTERDKWNRLTHEQVKTLVIEINLQVSQIIKEIQVELEQLTIISPVHEWYNMVFRFERKLKALRDSFPPYSAESYRSLGELRHRNILREFKEFCERRDYQERYLGLKAEVLALEEIVLEQGKVKSKQKEIRKQITELAKQMDSDHAALEDGKTGIQNITSTIIREKKSMQREISQMKGSRANALQRLTELRQTLKQKEILLKETTEQRQRVEAALEKEKKENHRLKKILNESLV